jgi:hypothetical protein
MVDLKANLNNAQPVKIASGLSEYRISLDGKKFFIWTTASSILRPRKQNKNRFRRLRVLHQRRGTKLLYVDDEDTMYYSDSKSGGEVQKLDSDVYIQNVSKTWENLVS